MIADLKPYPAMRDSGVPWLGDVPSHWTRLNRSSLLPGKEGTIQQGFDGRQPSCSLSYGHIVVKPPENRLHGLVPASFETYQIVEPGDIIVRPTDLQNDWTSLRFGLSRDRGIITSAYMCLYTEEVVMRPYGHLLLHTYDLEKVFYGLAFNGLRQATSTGANFKSTYDSVLCPPSPRANRHRPLSRPRRQAHPALHPRQAEADHAAGGAEAGNHPPGRHGPNRRPEPAGRIRPTRTLRRGVAGESAGALGGETPRQDG